MTSRRTALRTTWSGMAVVEHVFKKYNVQHVPRTMQELLQDMGFRHVKPRPRHPKAATEEEMKRFKKS